MQFWIPGMRLAVLLLLFPFVRAAGIDDYVIEVTKEGIPSYTVGDFLQYCEDHEDWERGGWHINSHMTSVAREIFYQICGTQQCGLEDPNDLVPVLEKGIEAILKHYNPRDGLVGDLDAPLVNRLGGTLKGTNIYWEMGMEHPYLKELADTLIRLEQEGRWRAEGIGIETVPRNVAELASLCLETINYPRDELFWVLESVANWTYTDFDVESHTPKYGLGISATLLHWTECRFGYPLSTRSRGLGYPYVLTTKVGNWPNGNTRVRLVENPDFKGTKESDWFDRRQTRLRCTRREEADLAPPWCRGSLEIWLDPEAGVDVPEEMGTGVYRLRNLQPWEEGGPDVTILEDALPCLRSAARRIIGPGDCHCQQKAPSWSTDWESLINAG